MNNVPTQPNFPRHGSECPIGLDLRRPDEETSSRVSRFTGRGAASGFTSFLVDAENLKVGDNIANKMNIT